MPTLAANLSLLFADLPLLDRFAAAAKAGFRTVELQFPYTETKAALSERLAATGQTICLFNLPPGDPTSGDRGLAALPGRVADFEAALQTALAYAQALNCPRLHVMAGIPPAGSDWAELTATYRRNLGHAADRARSLGITLLIEPLNQRDMPGYFLQDTAQAVATLEAVDRPNLKLQFDAYHVAISEGDVVTRMEKLMPWIGHVQIANPPGRLGPGQGELDLPFLLHHLDQLGYTGPVGLEYRPDPNHALSFDWAREFGVVPR